MKDNLPSPDFDSGNYARPNQNWTCGNACDGKACRLGPDRKGNCGATPECTPVLEKKPGDTKGRWKCTRASGECESGPLPDGTCCKQATKCSPVPTLRLWRGRITLATIAATCAFLLIALGNNSIRNRIFNPGRISATHSSEAFFRAAATNHIDANCGACHVAGTKGAPGLVHAAMISTPAPWQIRHLARPREIALQPMDVSCQQCHAAQSFHHVAAQPTSCLFCHQEHLGSKMAEVAEQNCAFCHGNETIMATAAKAGNHEVQLSSHFPEQHPQFQFITEKRHDPDTLKFNHTLHLTSQTVPMLPGKKALDCAFCHRTDSTGTLMRPVNFEENCRVCHSLQFDPETPELSLPHGNAAHVSAFLRTLSKQYEDLAIQKHVADKDAFVRRKLINIRTQLGTGLDMERRVFFSNSTIAPEIKVGTVSGATRAVYSGCAYCHAVAQTETGGAEISKPVFVERWLTGGAFNHESHKQTACAKCHDAVHSKDTADIIIPAKESCAECHSVKGGIRSSCSECHFYHKKPEPASDKVVLSAVMAK